jgi:two-component system chemotaxis response regulator CheY
MITKKIGREGKSMDELILIVDDARFARRVERKTLENAGFDNIIEANNAKEALAAFKENKPALTILDITLPDNTDLTLLKQMLEVRPEAKIIMNSAIGQELIIEDALAAGAKEFITKPFKEKEFIEKVAKVIEDN